MSKKKLAAIIVACIVIVGVVVGIIIATSTPTPESEYTPMLTAGDAHTVGLKTGGTVVATGWNDYGQCNVGGWDLN